MSIDELIKLCDPQRNTLPAAIKLARHLKEQSPLLDVELAQLMPPRVGEEGLHLDAPIVERALEILDVISEGSRVLNRLSHLLSHDNDRIRSKAALLVGRRVGTSHWAKRAEKDLNHRVRANVIEALWGSNLPRCREMLNRALFDSDNRVVGNAIYGIYRLAPAESIPHIEALAVDPIPGRRITAAWVMGQTEDWQFHSLLQTMIKDEESRVRSMALKSMFRIKRARSSVVSPFTNNVPAEMSR